MKTTSRITIPIDEKLRQKLKAKAQQLGFDSSQALLRYVSKAIVDGREVTFGQDDWGSPPAQAVVRWQKEIQEHEQASLSGNGKSYNDASELVKDLLADEAD